MFFETVPDVGLPAAGFRGISDGSPAVEPVPYKPPQEMTVDELVARVLYLEMEVERLEDDWEIRRYD